MKLPYDRDWYPVKHKFKGVEIPHSEVGGCFAKTDWKNDTNFTPGILDHLTSATLVDQHLDFYEGIKVTDDLEMINERIKTKKIVQRDYCVREYYNSVEKMFDAHMTSLAEQYKGKYTVLCSGGIDSNMMASWLYKNKLDFNVVGFTDGPRYNIKNTKLINDTISIWKRKHVSANIKELDGHLLVNDYITGSSLASVPKPAVMNLDGYDERTIGELKQDCDWILHGNGSNATMLHTGKWILPAFNSLDTKWKSFITSQTFSKVGYPSIFETVYNAYSDWSPLWGDNLYVVPTWNSDSVRCTDHGSWRSYSRQYENNDDKFLNLANENWLDLWETIDWSKLDLDLIDNCLSAKIWKSYISQHVDDGLADLTHTLNSSTKIYSTNTENQKILQRLLSDLLNRFRGNLKMIREIMACQWLMDRYNRIIDNGLALCHMESFLQKNNH
jgi:hypothetical protein